LTAISRRPNSDTIPVDQALDGTFIRHVVADEAHLRAVARYALDLFHGGRAGGLSATGDHDRDALCGQLHARGLADSAGAASNENNLVRMLKSW